MNKKALIIFILILILFVGLIAVTQETDVLIRDSGENIPLITENRTEQSEDYTYIYENTAGLPEWVGPVKWFRSNSGGMALEEVPSQIIALRNEFALSVDFRRREELPEFFLPYFNDNYFIEARKLYEDGRLFRTQWILRDINGTTRVTGVFYELSAVEITEEDDADDEEEKVLKVVEDKKQMAGFMEIYNENSYMVSEYRFLDNGNKHRLDYTYSNMLLTNVVFFLWEKDEDDEDEDGNIIVNESGEYKRLYTDFLRYNRSLFLRSVERVFHKDSRITFSQEFASVSFPRNLADASHIKDLIGEKLNVYPEFFGEVYIHANERIVYTTDDRSRIISQTLYDEDNNILWVINNTWLNDRIISTSKTEGDTEYMAEFIYDSGGDRIVERNYKNGILERVVRTEGKTDIEELYFNNIIMLIAVWEDGRKISETRVDHR